MSVALVDPEGAIRDWRGWSEGFAPPADEASPLPVRVQRWLSEGEHLQLEYKQALGASKVNLSFAETVAAFANSIFGGTILIGVTDEATIVGYGEAKTKDQITSIIRDTLVESVDVLIEETEVQGHPIQVVSVPPGDPQAKPYRASGRVMIRAGGTTREATTWEIRQLVSLPEAASWPLGARR
jgi:predicted HTH transcriptional regulator